MLLWGMPMRVKPKIGYTPDPTKGLSPKRGNSNFIITREARNTPVSALPGDQNGCQKDSTIPFAISAISPAWGAGGLGPPIPPGVPT
jgi:hypothetical protein